MTDSRRFYRILLVPIYTYTTSRFPLIHASRLIYQLPDGFTTSNYLIFIHLTAFAICNKVISFIFNNLMASFVTLAVSKLHLKG